jgi:hypothetical protein
VRVSDRVVSIVSVEFVARAKMLREQVRRHARVIIGPSVIAKTLKHTDAQPRAMAIAHACSDMSNLPTPRTITHNRSRPIQTTRTLHSHESSVRHCACSTAVAPLVSLRNRWCGCASARDNNLAAHCHHRGRVSRLWHGCCRARAPVCVRARARVCVCLCVYVCASEC